MSDDTKPSTLPITLRFELERTDNPLLYDDLIRVKKGAKRVNRLRTLAHHGLIAEQQRSNPPVIQMPQATALPGNPPSDAPGEAEPITNQLFAAPLVD